LAVEAVQIFLDEENQYMYIIAGFNIWKME